VSPAELPRELPSELVAQTLAVAHLLSAVQITDRMEIRKAVQSGDVEQVGAWAGQQMLA